MNRKVLTLLVIAIYCFLKVEAKEVKANKNSWTTGSGVSNRSNKTLLISMKDDTEKPIESPTEKRKEKSTEKPVDSDKNANKAVNLRVYVGDVNFDINSGDHKNLTLRVNSTGDEEQVNVFVDPIEMPN